MEDFYAFIWVAAGVFTSAIVPIAIKYINQFKPKPVGLSETVRDVIIKYASLAACSLVIGFVTLASIRFLGAKLENWYEPFLLGYLFDSSIQKAKQAV